LKEKRNLCTYNLGFLESDILYDSLAEQRVHPTQKPVSLLEKLINAYSNPGETVLDNTMGSGSTGVACVNTGRDFIGIELDRGYFEIAKQRIEDAMRRL
jgi:DNA modification methylase